MKISLNWIKKYVSIPVSDAELVSLIGSRLVEVEDVIDETEKYNNIYIVKVLSAQKIPDTHLTLCQIDVGKLGEQQVVCGAPNVREGMLAVWIAPGAVVPASVHEDSPFVIGKRKMLGKYDSFGMLAGADELDFGDDHSGIVEIEPGTAEPGEALSDVFMLKDLVLDIENKSLTHRPDTFGVIGFSREVAGILGESFDYEYKDVEIKPTGDIKISIEDKKICERYTAVVLEKHGEMKRKYLTLTDTLLSKSGVRPISPIVDVTNYLMLLTGQPLHAFDYDKFVKVGKTEKPEIRVRLARKGEKLVLLDDSEVILNTDDIVICSGDTPVALAGAMGGKSTMIDENTKNIIIEAATFSLYNLRKTQMAHGIFSEAITRFTKGQPAYQCLMVAEAAAKMLEDGFKVSSVADSLKNEILRPEVMVSFDEINGLLGTDYSPEVIVRTLTNVGFEVRQNKENLKVTAPEWRTDIHIKEDVIEEVGRLLGYDNIIPVLPRHMTAEKNPELELKTRAREILSRFGANEVLTYSFISSRLLERTGLSKNNSYKIVNSISPELQYVRQSIVPSLLEKAYLNQKIPVDQFALFEMNKVYEKKDGLDSENVPVEKMNLGFVVLERKNPGTAYFLAKKYLEEFMNALGIKMDIRPLKVSNAIAKPFEPKRAAEIVVNNEVIGVVGEFKNSVRRNFKLPEFVAGFELDFYKLLENVPATLEIDPEPISEKRDLTIETEKTYGEVLNAVQKVLDKHNLQAKVTPLAIYQPENTKHISVHLDFKQKIDEKIMHELEDIK